MATMIICPYCQETNRQVKAGLSDGAQRYKCMRCGRRYIPEPRQRGHSEDVRRQAQTFYAQGMRISQIASQMGVNPRSVVKWVRPEADHAPETNALLSAQQSVPSEPPVAETSAAKKRATIDDVAALAGVSNSTISNYLNNKGRMSDATRDRVKAAMDELHFTPSALVRAIRQKRTQILGVYVLGLASLGENVGATITPQILGGIAQAAGDAHLNLLVYTGWEAHAEGNTGQEFLDGHIDGLIWLTPELSPVVLERVANAGLPVIALLSRHVPDNVGYVNIDNFGGMEALVRHLVHQGHRRIAYAGPNYASNFIDRRIGYRLALKQTQTPYFPELDMEMGYEWWTDEGCQITMDALLSLPDPPTAIVTADDGLAQRMTQAAQARGLRIPQDIAFTGFNDVPNAEAVVGGLTTIRQPFRQLGVQAVERLTAFIGGASPETCRVTVPGELVIRASTLGHERVRKSGD